MQYLSLENTKIRILLVKTRDLSTEDIAKLAGFSSWPLYEAVYYALGKYPLAPSSSSQNLDPDTCTSLSDNYLEIHDKVSAAIRAGELRHTQEAGPNNSTLYHLKPQELLKWLVVNGYDADARLCHAVFQNEREKEDRRKRLEGLLTETVPPFILPSETDAELWAKSQKYISGSCTSEAVGLSAKAEGAKRTGMYIRLFRQKAYYETLLHVKCGCKCLHQNLVKLVEARLRDHVAGLKPGKIQDYVEAGVVAALKESGLADRICSDRYPNGKSNPPASCPYHPR
jgi:hypothetical protein